MTDPAPTPQPDEPADDGLSPAPDPFDPPASPSGEPIGTAPGGKRGCLGGSAAAVLALGAVTGGAAYAAVQIWRSLTG